MQEILIHKLHDYIRENNPDLLVTLEQENRVTEYLQQKVSSIDSMIETLVDGNKPGYEIEEQCLTVLTEGLRPSKFIYIQNILEEGFSRHYERLERSGILITEVINMIRVCDPLFHEFEFSEASEDDRHLRYAITGMIHKYLNTPATDGI